MKWVLLMQTPLNTYSILGVRKDIEGKDHHAWILVEKGKPTDLTDTYIYSTEELAWMAIEENKKKSEKLKRAMKYTKPYLADR